MLRRQILEALPKPALPEDITRAVTNAGFTTPEDVANALANAGYVTPEQLGNGSSGIRFRATPADVTNANQVRIYYARRY